MKSLIYFTWQIFKNIGIFLFFILSLISCSITNSKTLGSKYEDDGIYYNPKKDKIHRADKEVYEYGSQYNERINEKQDSTPNEEIGIGRYYFDQYGNGPEKTYYDQPSKNENENSSRSGLLNRSYSSDFGVKTGTNVAINNWGGLYGWGYPYYNYWGWGGYDPWFGWGRSYPYSGWSLGFSSLYGWGFGYGLGWGYPYYRHPYYFGYSPYYGYSGYYYSRYRSYYGLSHYHRPRYRRSSENTRQYKYRPSTQYKSSQYRRSGNTRQYQYRPSTQYKSSQYRRSGNTRQYQYRPSTQYKSSQYRRSGNTRQYQYRPSTQYKSSQYRSSNSRSYSGSGSRSYRSRSFRR